MRKYWNCDTLGVVLAEISAIARNNVSWYIYLKNGKCIRLNLVDGLSLWKAWKEVNE